MTWIGSATAELRQLSEEAARIREQAYGMQEDLYNLGESFKQTANDIGDIVENDLPTLLDSIVYQVEQTTKKAGTRLDDFMFTLEDIAASGNLWAEQLVGMIKQVEEGILDAQDVMGAFGDAQVQFEGKLVSVRDILQDLLPSVGQVRSEIRQMMDELERDGFTLEDLIGRLRQQHVTYAHDFARLLEAFKKGRATLEAVIQAARKLQQQFPGSEAGELAGLIQGLLLEDDD